tara:strand:+ start:63 stop:557 length:495 start_codon:yes stop_codon:yes gene_type:complete
MNYWVYRAPSSVRDLFLDYIERDKGASIKEDHSMTQISKSNWNSDTKDPTFARLFQKYYFEGYAHFLYEKVKRDFDWTNMWYQVYEKNSSDCHDFHNHFPGISLANVFYLELKSRELVTQFKDMSPPDVNEGDTLIFDPTLMHRSPPNNTSDRKVVISFNVNFL